DVVNIGAAGTFVVRKPASAAKIRAEFLRRLPFEPEVIVVGGREVLDLAAGEAFSKAPSGRDMRLFVTVLSRAPRPLPPLPVLRPSEDAWQVALVNCTGRFVLSHWRRQGRTFLYPNEVVEKVFGVPATTRGSS